MTDNFLNKDKSTTSPIEDVLELEEISELPEIEPQNIINNFNLLNNSNPSVKAYLDKKVSIKDIINSYSNVPVPIGILDENLTFIFMNEEMNKIFVSFNLSNDQNLFSAFGRFIEEAQIKQLYNDLHNISNKFSWQGSFQLHSKDTSSVIANTTILPFYPSELDSSDSNPQIHPKAWLVFIDDITNERNLFINSLFASLLQASKLKDNDTGMHIERVSLYAECMAKKMYKDPRWPEIDIDFIDNIGSLAAMHDVGKIGTPDDILNKKGSLSEFEWSIMKEHTINGAYILSSHPNPMAKQIAQSHHEWWNGTGYPYKLQGEMIPLAARIVAIADVYDALRMRRSYKAPCDHSMSSLLIVADSGRHFDPLLVNLFKTISDQFKKIFDDRADE